MGRFLDLFAGVAWLIAGAPDPALAQDAQDEQYARDVAGWNIAGLGDICLAGSPWADNEGFGFGLIDDSFVVEIASLQRLPSGHDRRVTATLSIDGGWERRATGLLDDRVAEFRFDPEDTLVERLRTGGRLRIDMAEGVFTLDLTGSAAVLAALWECGWQLGVTALSPADTGAGP